MASRLSLQRHLERQILGSRNVYFQPPESIQMKYPAIRYSLYDIESDYADNSVYSLAKKYQLTYIDEDPDSPIVDKIAAMPSCRFVRFFTADGLNHWVFVIYY